MLVCKNVCRSLAEEKSHWIDVILTKFGQSVEGSDSHVWSHQILGFGRFPHLGLLWSVCMHPKLHALKSNHHDGGIKR